jgi:hypothetical protein
MLRRVVSWKLADILEVLNVSIITQIIKTISTSESSSVFTTLYDETFQEESHLHVSTCLKILPIWKYEA